MGQAESLGLDLAILAKCLEEERLQLTTGVKREENPKRRLTNDQCF
jgi:hypothetical protein